MLEMGIIKVEINFPELKEAVTNLAVGRKAFFELLGKEIKAAASGAVESVLNSEMTIFLGRPSEKDNRLNGSKRRSYAIKGIGGITFKMPKDRKNRFKSELMPAGERIDSRLKEDMAVLHLAGISTRDLSMISSRILGMEVSKQTVSNSLESIEAKAVAWLTRPITKKYWALYIDGTNFKIQRRGSTEAEPSLVVLGVDETDRKSILAIEPGAKDNADAWEAVFNELIKRGLQSEGIRIGIMDGLPGLEEKFKKIFSKAVTARCWLHAKKNAMAKVPARLRDGFNLLLEGVMYASSEDAARQGFRGLKTTMGKDAERAVKCLEKDIDSLLVHYRFEKKYWIALKTTNPIERINKEFKKRYRSMGSLGERTLECLLAFTALRLEMGWRNNPIDARKLANLRGLRDKSNAIEQTVTELLN
jgi:putative transposase